MSRDISQLANDVQVIYTDEDGYMTITSAATDSDSDTDYWTREAHITIGDCDDTVAEYYRDLYLDKYKDALLKFELTIGAPFIKDAYGRSWPLWEPIRAGGGYLRLNNILPDESIFTKSWDRLRTGQIMDMRYSSNDSTLRVTLDQESSALDAVIARMDALR
jgi:hypothetical protein